METPQDNPSESSLLQHMREAVARGDWDTAARVAGSLVRLRPGSAQAHYNLGVALLKTHAWDAAQQAFGDALRIAPEHDKARRGLEFAARMLEPQATAESSPAPTEDAAFPAQTGVPPVARTSSQPRAKRRVLRACARHGFVAAAVCVLFFAGMRFERWGGVDRLAPVIVNLVREKLLGDDTVLALERSYYHVEDSFRRRRNGTPRLAAPAGPHGPAAESRLAAPGAPSRRVALFPTTATLMAAAAAASGTSLTLAMLAPTTTTLAMLAPTTTTLENVATATLTLANAPLSDAIPITVSATPVPVRSAAPTSTTLTAARTEALRGSGPSSATLTVTADPSPGRLRATEKAGEWENFEISEKSGRPLWSHAVFRPDPERDYAVVHAYRFDLDRLRLEYVPARDTAHGLSGRMAPRQIEKVEWIFNGGFQYRHGRYGIRYADATIYPPRSGAATLMFLPNGGYDIVVWPENDAGAPAATTFRQNEIPLIMGGALSSRIDRTWGFTPKDQDPMYTERSAMGFTANNELVFAVGKPVSARTLAEAMRQAGVVKAMHLDMNHYNVHLLRAQRREGGALSTTNAVALCSYYGRLYLDPSERDFFILTSRE